MQYTLPFGFFFTSLLKAFAIRLLYQQLDLIFVAVAVATDMNMIQCSINLP